MIRFLALAVLLAAPAGLLAQDPAPTPKDDLSKASAKTAALENYKFSGTLEVDNMPMIPSPMDVAGSFVKDGAFHVETEILGPIYRVGKKVAMKDPETGDWLLAKAGRKVGEGNNQLLVVAARGMKAPHDWLKKVEDRFVEVRKSPAEKIGGKDHEVFEGKLSADGVKQLLPGGIGMFLKLTETEGTAKVYVDPDGRIAKFETGKCKVKGEMNGQEFEFEVKQTWTISGIGEAKIELPADVKKLFEGADEEKDKDDAK